MLLVRGIAFLLTGLLLGGCMQSGTLAPASDAKFTTRDKQQLTNPPYQQAWIPPAYQRQVVPYHRKETPGPWARMLRPGPVWPQSAARKNGRDGRQPRVRRGGSARFRTMSKAVHAIRWVRARCTFTPAARTHCIASTARTSQNGSDMRFRQAAFD